VALPLLVGNRVLGALDIQSTDTGVMSDAEITVLQLVADQVAVGLENARLFSQTQSSLNELSQLYEVTTRDAWQRFVMAQPQLHRYHLSGGEVADDRWQTLFAEARGVGRPVAGRLGNGDDGQVALAIPIKLRGTPIGVVGVHRPTELGTWQPEDTALGEGLAERVAQALENARLLAEAQYRAARDRVFGEVTARMRETLDVDRVLQTAIREIGEALGLPKVEVRMGRPVSRSRDGRHTRGGTPALIRGGKEGATRAKERKDAGLD
jgi:GAF domain-containing protein